MKKLAILALAAVALAACAGGTHKAAPTSSAPTTAAPTTAAPATVAPTTTAPKPTTTRPRPTTTTAKPKPKPKPVDPMKAAQMAYYVISATNNGALDALNKQYLDANGNLTARNAKAYCAAVAPLEEKFANDVKGYAWPASVKAAADDLVKALAAEAGDVYACANAKTGSEALGLMNTAHQDAASAAASTMRLALGLPINRQ